MVWSPILTLARLMDQLWMQSISKMWGQRVFPVPGCSLGLSLHSWEILAYMLLAEVLGSTCCAGIGVLVKGPL